MIPPLTPPLKPRGEDQIEHAVILGDHRQPVNQIEHAVTFGEHPHARQPARVGFDIKKTASIVFEADCLFARSEAYAPCSVPFSGRFAAQA